ncbi:MAG TPA: hypothetical protein VGF69_11800, partial [Thermoanaerobaculia bacterium]
MRALSWLLAAAVSAYACHLGVQHGTPIDAALPLLALIATAVAWATSPAVMLAVPMLLAGELALPDERLRLLYFGVVMAGAFSWAVGGGGGGGGG